ncbi:DUF3135 domain-containing protein [Sedimenticola thiotaurini]|uniref:DUF3135 domain-containing protein n=1 Tax=Sedimenticola thiotaurini TaxID=1543721 RepID=UPI00069AD765|nr:DUF3135 domain-containing protein [Sedimenticola thiotaurini]
MQPAVHQQKVDFDQWLKLASTDMPAFEALRRTLINQVIEQASEEQRDRLRRLQWRIDQERRRCKSPMGACVRISRMMWDRLMGRDGLLERLQELTEEGFPRSSRITARAKVIPLAKDRTPGD